MVSGMVYLQKVAPLCNGMQQFLFLFILLNVFEGATHQVRSRAAFEEPRLEAGVATPTGGAL